MGKLEGHALILVEQRAVARRATYDFTTPRQIPVNTIPLDSTPNPHDLHPPFIHSYSLQQHTPGSVHRHITPFSQVLNKKSARDLPILGISLAIRS